MFVQYEERLHSIAVWPDAIPTLIPAVDSLLVPRKDFAPRRLLRRTDDQCFVPFDQVQFVLDSFATNDYAIPAFCLRYTSIPTDISEFVKSIKPISEPLEGIAMDQILNQELVDKYKKK